MRRRFAARASDGSRHPGHVDETISAEIDAALEAARRGPLDLEGERIDVDTSGPAQIEIGPIAERIRLLVR